MKKFKLSLIATGVGAALAMALSGPVLANGHNEDENHQSQGTDSGNVIHDVGSSAVATDHASASYVELGDVSVGVYSANTTLNGTVKNNGSDGINGNTGGSGGGAGDGGVGNNGSAGALAGSAAIGGDGGNGGDVGASDGGHGGHGGGDYSIFGYGDEHEGGGNNGSSGGTAGDGGDAHGLVASGALALAATGNGADGGNGGSANGGSAGSFIVSNSISNSSFAGAAGIMNVSQNTGANSLTQQGVTVQGNVNF